MQLNELQNNDRENMIITGDIALFEPEIAVNTGNIIRLCAGLKARLHLIHPMGFTFNDKGLKRAGLDYHDLADITEHQCFESFINTIAMPVIAMTTKAKTCLFQTQFEQKVCLLFGPESRGLNDEILKDQRIANLVKIPQVPTHRSLNLSNAVAVAAYEQARQLTCYRSK